METQYIIILICILAIPLLVQWDKKNKESKKKMLEESHRFTTAMGEYLLHDIVKNVAYGDLSYTDYRGNIINMKEKSDYDRVLEEILDYKSGKIDRFGSFCIMDGPLTKERLDNFNRNMKHIMYWNRREKKYKTVSENLKIREFRDVNNINEFLGYMGEQDDKGDSNLDKLMRIGKGGKPTKIIYDYGNEEGKTLKEKGTLEFLDFFKKLDEL